jgi:hypothetical protein
MVNDGGERDDGAAFVQPDWLGCDIEASCAYYLQGAIFVSGSTPKVVDAHFTGVGLGVDFDAIEGVVGATQHTADSDSILSPGIRTGRVGSCNGV